MPKQNTMQRLLARLEHWQTPDGLDVEPRRVEPQYIRFSGKLTGKGKKLEAARKRYEAAWKRYDDGISSR